MTAYKLRCHRCDDADYPDVGALIDHLRAAHDDLYDLTDEDYDTPTDSLYQLRALDVFSDALLFSANAEIERLKCCGNCTSAYDCGDYPLDDPCHFTPSRWAAREETR